MQGSIQKAVAGRAIQERCESDSRAIRSDSHSLNEKDVVFVWVLDRGQSDSSVPSYPLYNIKKGEGTHKVGSPTLLARSSFLWRCATSLELYQRLWRETLFIVGPNAFGAKPFSVALRSPFAAQTLCHEKLASGKI